MSFKIAEGEHVAITGPSGSGKSTIMKLAVGMLHPSEGEVLYGGVPIARLGVHGVRGVIGTVLQDDVLLSGSIMENICFFDNKRDDAFARQCAAIAAVDMDMQAMPMGYQTFVGDLGNGFSGGQVQRLLLARALYKRPKCLILDEATSHLDPRNERSVVTELNKMKLTRIVIAHRPETVSAAERALVVKNGSVEELQRRATTVVQAVG